MQSASKKNFLNYNFGYFSSHLDRALKKRAISCQFRPFDHLQQLIEILWKQGIISGWKRSRTGRIVVFFTYTRMGESPLGRITLLFRTSRIAKCTFYQVCELMARGPVGLSLDFILLTKQGLMLISQAHALGIGGVLLYRLDYLYRSKPSWHG